MLNNDLEDLQENWLAESFNPKPIKPHKYYVLFIWEVRVDGVWDVYRTWYDVFDTKEEVKKHIKKAQKDINTLGVSKTQLRTEVCKLQLLKKKIYKPL